jgi:hypothetical protein
MPDFTYTVVSAGGATTGQGTLPRPQLSFSDGTSEIPTACLLCSSLFHPGKPPRCPTEDDDDNDNDDENEEEDWDVAFNP